MDIVAEFQHLMTKGQMWVGFAQLYHPLLVVAERDIMVAEVLVDVTLEFVDELLLSKPINLLGNKRLVVAQGRHHTVDKGEPFVVPA